jgi:hypothetical protein
MGGAQTAYLLDDSWSRSCLNSKKCRVNTGGAQTAHPLDDTWIRPCLNSQKC